MEDFFEDIKNRPRPNLLKKIQLWWNHDGRYYHKYFKHGVKNLWYWFPIIWKDRNWDYHYIFEIMKHKLKGQADYIGRRNRHTKAQQDSRRMRLCVKLMQKIQDGDYTLEHMEYAKNRHWFTQCKDKPGYLEWNTETLSENYDEYFKKYPLVYKRVINGEGPFSLKDLNNVSTERTQRIAMNIGHINEDRAKELLFKIMKDNILGWWD
jgi:hypothetical protein